MNCKNLFEKKLYKFISNAIYGKSLQNVKKQRDIKLVNQWNGRYGAKSLISKPNFKNTKIFNENLIAVELSRMNVKIDKPIIIGVAILEISKLTMYRFHYEFMLTKYSHEKCRMAYTDTDSFIYCIEDEDVYEMIKSNPNEFDEKSPGKMSDENSGQIMTEFVGLRAKMYSYRTKKSKSKICESKRAKGVKKHLINKKLTFNDFLKCVQENTTVCGTQPLITSKFHDKRYIANDKVATLAWGHYALNK